MLVRKYCVENGVRQRVQRLTIVSELERERERERERGGERDEQVQDPQHSKSTNPRCLFYSSLQYVCSLFGFLVVETL